MSWQPNVKMTEQVDVNHPSFPWKNGKPDWGYWHLIKAAEREEKYRNTKHQRAAEYCCAVDNDGPCIGRSLGKIELMQNGRPVLAPLCQKHKDLYVNDDNV